MRRVSARPTPTSDDRRLAGPASSTGSASGQRRGRCDGAAAGGDRGARPRNASRTPLTGRRCAAGLSRRRRPQRLAELTGARRRSRLVARHRSERPRAPGAAVDRACAARSATPRGRGPLRRRRARTVRPASITGDSPRRSPTQRAEHAGRPAAGRPSPLRPGPASAPAPADGCAARARAAPRDASAPRSVTGVARARSSTRLRRRLAAVTQAGRADGERRRAPPRLRRATPGVTISTTIDDRDGDRDRRPGAGYGSQRQPPVERTWQMPQHGEHVAQARPGPRPCGRVLAAPRRSHRRPASAVVANGAGFKPGGHPRLDEAGADDEHADARRRRSRRPSPWASASSPALAAP